MNQSKALNPVKSVGTFCRLLLKQNNMQQNPLSFIYLKRLKSHFSLKSIMIFTFLDFVVTSLNNRDAKFILSRILSQLVFTIVT